jgi:hypothetical protein
MLTREKRKFYSIALLILFAGSFLILSGYYNEDRQAQAIADVTTPIIEADSSGQESLRNMEIGKSQAVGIKELGAILMGLGALLLFSKFLK